METKSKLGQEAAFAGYDPEIEIYEVGISKRLYIATAAMQGLSNKFTGLYSTQRDIEGLVKQSYKIADEMLKQEQDEN